MVLSRDMCGREARRGGVQASGCRRKTTAGCPRGRKKHPGHHHQQQQAGLQRPSGSGSGSGGATLLRLRPINRARGMRAPKNTNQFLMHEKYQMMHMRSDSVGSDTGGSCSDSDLELTDMDSYLGALENARGALPEGPEPEPEPPSGTRRDQVVQHEDSMQYFPSEDDLLQSHNFMQRDFAQFCDFLTS
ncbi:coiled-coil domain-containing glutamate-rich protein 1 [Syngnathoides biaculeatus]|uniref:coiled-coil domain-containing glutamate-rich protein 1 n=1 Tax=Syngnathoides biaculeatus TaxID=300417 RepID=UPI002ADD94C2|nr:coiled-coil domain-containing glutamate-rich protein 1 [Syngnathoides biaculeatus]